MLILTTAGQSAIQFISVLLIFVFVLAVTYFTSKYIGSYQKEKIQGNNITVIETQRIAQNKFVQIVKIGDKFFALAICKDTVTTISEISEDSLNLSQQSAEKMSFKEFFNKAKEEENE